MTDEALVASATGTLDKTPLSNLLVYCLDRSLSGTLVLQSTDDLRHALYVEQGHPAKVRTGGEVALLGEMLVEQGLCTRDDIEDALVASNTLGCALGEALVQAGKVEHPALLAVLRAQITRKTARLAALPGGTAFGFYEGKNLLDAWGGPELTPVDALSLIWQAVRASAGDARIDASLAQLGDRPLKLHVDGDFRRFQITDRVRGVVDLLKMKPCSLAQLCDAGVAPEREIKLLVYSFLITRHVDLGAGGKPPVGAQPPESKPPESIRTAVARVRLKGGNKVRSVVEVGPPSSRDPLVPGQDPRTITSDSPETEARRKEIKGRAEAIDKEDYFTMLGVPRDAPSDVLQSAYFSLAKRWHPDRLPLELGDVREQSSRVFSRISEAFQTLTDAEKRARYQELLKEGGGSPEEQAKVTLLLEAQMEFQKAEILLKKGDLPGAEKLATKAATKDPEQVDYGALLSWIRATQPGATTAVTTESIEALTGFLAREPNHQRSLWYRGVLLKRLGNEPRAMQDFRKLLELDPKHLDATREVRIFEMRNPTGKPGEGPKPSSQVPFGNMFGKLFNKK